jgi:hypothetical protein
MAFLPFQVSQQGKTATVPEVTLRVVQLLDGAPAQWSHYGTSR